MSVLSISEVSQLSVTAMALRLEYILDLARLLRSSDLLKVRFNPLYDDITKTSFNIMLHLMWVATEVIDVHITDVVILTPEKAGSFIV